MIRFLDYKTEELYNIKLQENKPNTVSKITGTLPMLNNY